MFDQLSKCDATVKRYLTAPLMGSRLSYLAHWAEQGAKPLTLRRMARSQVMAIRYLDLGERGKVSESALDDAVRGWAARDTRRREPSSASRQTFVRHVTGWLQFADRWEEPADPLRNPFAREIADFEHYMGAERGCSESTIHGMRGSIGNFLRRLTQQGLSLPEVTITTIDEALCEKGVTTGCSRATINAHADALRSFFRYA